MKACASVHPSGEAYCCPVRRDERDEGGRWKKKAEWEEGRGEGKRQGKDEIREGGGKGGRRKGREG